MSADIEHDTKVFKDGHEVTRTVLERGNITSEHDIQMAVIGMIVSASMTVAHKVTAVDKGASFKRVQARCMREWAAVMVAQANSLEV